MDIERGGGLSGESIPGFSSFKRVKLICFFYFPKSMHNTVGNGALTENFNLTKRVEQNFHVKLEGQ